MKARVSRPRAQGAQERVQWLESAPVEVERLRASKKCNKEKPCQGIVNLSSSDEAAPVDG